MSESLEAHAVILGGGRGTRFWPRSRTRTPKQLLNIMGSESMLQQTVRRLLPVFPAARMWVVTNEQQAPRVERQVPTISPGHILAEPEGRSTAAAIGLAAIHLVKASRAADALMAVLPADHYIANAPKYRRIVRAALQVAARGPNLVVLGIPPRHAETGYGYIERGARAARARGWQMYQVRRFIEKPTAQRAKEYVASGRYLWNAGMFFWRASTFLKHLEEFLPDTYSRLRKLAEYVGTPRYDALLQRVYPRMENISVDYAIMEPATRRPAQNVFVLPAEVGWSDIGSWAAVYELLAKKAGENVCAGAHVAWDARGNFLWSPEKFVAAIGVRDLVVVETRQALLLCPRNRAQEVGKVVQWLEKSGHKGLL
jgi:mannose-1-phosphate guanylyltransferase